MNANRRPILRWLTTQLASYLEVPATAISPMVPLAEMGVDSVHAISLVGDVEHPQTGVRAAAAPLHFLCVVRMIFLVDGERYLFAVNRERHGHESVRRLRKRRMVVVFADGARLADVGDVDYAHAPVPAAGP